MHNLPLLHISSSHVNVKYIVSFYSKHNIFFGFLFVSLHKYLLFIIFLQPSKAIIIFALNRRILILHLPIPLKIQNLTFTGVLFFRALKSLRYLQLDIQFNQEFPSKVINAKFTQKNYLLPHNI